MVRLHNRIFGGHRDPACPGPRRARRGGGPSGLCDGTPCVCELLWPRAAANGPGRRRAARGRDGRERRAPTVKRGRRAGPEKNKPEGGRRSEATARYRSVGAWAGRKGARKGTGHGARRKRRRREEGEGPGGGRAPETAARRGGASVEGERVRVRAHGTQGETPSHDGKRRGGHKPAWGGRVADPRQRREGTHATHVKRAGRRRRRRGARATKRVRGGRGGERPGHATGKADLGWRGAKRKGFARRGGRCTGGACG